MENNTKVIAIVDDEPDIVELIKVNLERARFNTKCFYDGNSILRYLENEIPALLILDLMLPDHDGFEICKKIRSNNKSSDLPIIMLTAKTGETDKILGLEFGADDYVTKPFSPLELVARVKAVLRRNGNNNITVTGNEVIQIGDILINNNKFEVTVNEKKIDLTATEVNILKILAEHKGWVYSREKIIEKLWNGEKYVSLRTIDVHIKNLREKLGENGNIIKNIRGVGYKIEE